MSSTIRPERAWWMLRTMRLVRQLSHRIVELYPTDVLETPVHLCIGQEAVSAGLCAHLRDEDKLFLGHRTHAPALAKGLPLNKLVAELYGRTTGCSHARGGSMHLIDFEHGLPGSSAIVGGNIALGVGGALSASLQGAEFLSVSYFGDAATNAGVFYESLNFATLRRLPVLFLCENNGYSNVMPMEQHSAHDIVGLASVFMPVLRADGTDALSVCETAGEAVARICEGEGPIFVECRTRRWWMHQGDQPCDLIADELDPDRDCPILKLERYLLGARLATRRQLAELEQALEAEIDAAIREAEAAPYPEIPASFQPDLLET